MHTVLVVLGGIGTGVCWILLALLVLLLLLLFVPVSVTLELKNSAFLAKLRVLGVPITLYPLTKKEKSAKPQKAKKAAKAKPQKPDQKTDATATAAQRAEQTVDAQHTGQKAESAEQSTAKKQDSTADKPKSKKKAFDLTPEKITKIAGTVGHLMREILRGLHVRDVQVVWPIHKDDAAQTAIAFGRTQAALGTALGAVQNLLDIRLKQVDIIPDFTGEYKDQHYFYCKIRAVLFIMIVAAVYALARLKADKVI